MRLRTADETMLSDALIPLKDVLYSEGAKLRDSRGVSASFLHPLVLFGKFPTPEGPTIKKI